MSAQSSSQRQLPVAAKPQWTGWLIALMAVTVLLYAIEISLHPLPPAVTLLFQKFAANAIFFGAAVLCVVKGRASPRTERSAWWLLAFALGLWGTGGFYYAVFLWGREVVPIPSVADVFWLAFYLPAYAALYKLLRNRARIAGRGALLDALVGALGVGGAGAALALQAVMAHTDGTAVETAVNLAYPVGDLGLLALVVAGITVAGWKASGVWRWIAPAFVIFAVADSIYVVRVAQGLYTGLVDLGWPVAALLIAIAAWRAETASVRAVERTGTIVVPAVFGVAAVALLVIDHYVRLNPLALVLATASILAMLVRLYLTVHDNALLLAKSRREATTDALTGLGNRRQLSADLTTHLQDLDPDRPVLLALFDLDGFKHYNDTFGHQAGDELLQRLGARLSALVASRGTAYRIGGDEFCLLGNLSDVGQASVTMIEAVSALSERGEAFSIGCSYGSVLLPNETTDSTHALRIADRRMYIRKGAGRPSAGQQSSDVLLRTLAERDSDLSEHLNSVADLACAVAARVGVPQDEMEAVRQTALLHDVGKVAIPDAILNKPSALNDSEWGFMKRHSVIGERIISAAPALGAVARFVRATHERYDGRGYPDALAGGDIPLTARIVTVCDAYHAMITPRAYRSAISGAAAIMELRRCSGAQFDPDVVEAFVSARDAADERELVAA